MNIILLALILLTVVFNTAAQIALKAGMVNIGAFAFKWENFFPITLKILASPWIILGLIIYIASVSIWLMVLSRVPVSIAYPMASLGYVISAIVAYYLLGEDLTIVRITGILIILIGVYIVAKS